MPLHHFQELQAERPPLYHFQAQADHPGQCSRHPPSQPQIGELLTAGTSDMRQKTLKTPA